MQSGKGVVHLTELESGDYKSICENLYDGIHITDGTGTILFINKAYTRTTGILPEELLGRKVSEIEAEGILYTGSVTERVLAQGKRINSVATIHRLNKEEYQAGSNQHTGLPRAEAAGGSTIGFGGKAGKSSSGTGLSPQPAGGR